MNPVAAGQRVGLADRFRRWIEILFTGTMTSTADDADNQLAIPGSTGMIYYACIPAC